MYRQAGIGITGVTSTGSRNAWAFGENDRHGQAGLLLHWNGSRWRSMSYPGERSFFPMALYAMSASDFWLAQYSTAQPTAMLHWDHGKWSTLQLPVNAQPLLVLSDTDIWIEGLADGPGPTCPILKPGENCLDIAHWNGSTWTNSTLPATGLATAAASSPSDVWAVGDVDYKQTPRSITFRPAVFRWTGASWRRVPLTGTRMGWTPPIVAYSARDVYVDEASTNHSKACAMHWNGSRWTPVYLRGNKGACGLLSTDYRRGIWLEPVSPLDGWVFAHWTGTRIVTTPAFGPAAAHGGGYQVAAVPHAGSVWLFGNYCTGGTCASMTGTIATLP